MLKLYQPTPALCDGFSRREWMRLGGISLGGLTLAQVLEQRQARAENQPPVRAKSVIVLFQSGGLPQHETFDPKPEAPAEIRGEFGSVSTRTPGLMVGELMPKTAAIPRSTKFDGISLECLGDFFDDGATSASGLRDQFVKITSNESVEKLGHRAATFLRDEIFEH